MTVRILWVQAEANLGLQANMKVVLRMEMTMSTNPLEPDNQDNQSHHDTYQPQLLITPSGMPPFPCLNPCPSEASERSSSLPTLPSLPQKGQHCWQYFVNEYGMAQCFLKLLPGSCKEEQQSQAAGGVRDEGGDGTNDGSGVPLARVWQRDRDWRGLTRLDGLGEWISMIGYSIHSLTVQTGGITEVNTDGLSGNPMFNINNEVTERGGNLFQGY